MSKFIRGSIAFLVLLITVLSPLFSQTNTVSADESTPTYANGEYEIPYTIYHETNDEVSMADGYYTKTAKVVIKDGEIKVQVEYDPFITEFKVNGTPVTILSQDSSKVIAEFSVDSLADIVESEIHVVVPMINYDHWYTVRFDFDDSSIPPAPVEVPEETTPIADGKYTFDYQVLKDNADEPSSLGNYLSKPAKLVVEGQKQYVIVTLSSSNFITAFKTEVNGQLVDAEILEEDTANNTRTLKFQIDDIGKTIHTSLSMSYGMTHTVRFVPNKNTVTVDNSTETPEEETPAVKDGKYTFDYQVLKDNADEPSSLGKYLSKPAKLVVENQKQYMIVTLSSSNFITAFKTELDGQLVDAEILEEDTANNTRTLKFQIDDINKTINTSLSMSYGMTHTVRIVPNANTLTVDDSTETPDEGEGENPGTTPGEGEGENPGTTPGEGEGENPGTTPGEGEGENP
ncbi:NEAT domain-containing protein, partial [Bacillus sp. B1-b2]|uniref:NEAT domain-containing protein n=1 Tax=Bacillus sp. B1-b2 TaxID=2653201 RepID=UPI001869F974